MINNAVVLTGYRITWVCLWGIVWGDCLDCLVEAGRSTKSWWHHSQRGIQKCVSREGELSKNVPSSLSALPIVKVLWPAASSHRHGLNPQTVSQNKSFLMLLLSEHFYHSNRERNGDWIGTEKWSHCCSYPGSKALALKCWALLLSMNQGSASELEDRRELNIKHGWGQILGELRERRQNKAQGRS